MKIDEYDQSWVGKTVISDFESWDYNGSIRITYVGRNIIVGIDSEDKEVIRSRTMPWNSVIEAGGSENEKL